MLAILRTLYSFLTRKKIWFVLLVVLIIVSSILESITPYFYKLFVEQIPLLNQNKLLMLLGLYMLISILSLIVSGIAFMVGDYILIDAASSARTEIFKHVQDLDFAFHTNKSTGSLISAFKRGDGAFFNLFHSLHFRILNIFVSFLVMLAFFSRLDSLIVITTIVSFISIMIAARFVVTYNVKTRMRFNDNEDDVSGVIVDNMMNYETVKLFAKENWELKRLVSAFVPWKKSLWDYGISFRYFDATLGTIINIAVFVTFLISLRLTLQNRLTLGDFVLVVGFVNSFYPRVFDLVWGFRDIAKNYADIERYFGLLDEKIEVTDPEAGEKKVHVKGEIAFKNATFSYKGGQKNALKGVNLTIRQGQSVALVGRSGSGKTTLIKMLMRFYDLEAGSILIDNTNITKFSKSKLRSFMGVVPQEPILFNNTIRYNIGYGKSGASMEEIRAAAKMAHIDGFIEKLSLKYETNVGERGIKLSGGQKQRLAIARMILSDPDIIIFDEATSHLDSESEHLIQDAFWKAAKNKTTIIIAHRLSTVKRADKIIVMERGKIKEIGSHHELTSRKESLYRHFWDLQVKV